MWAFPSKAEERIEDMGADELLQWHARAVRAKQRDAELIADAVAKALAALLRR